MDEQTETGATEPATTEAPTTTEAAPAADPHGVVDALEKYLEAELPMASFLIVQTACAEIRKHLP